MANIDRDGTINQCANAGCGYCCCDFSAGNYIVLYPGELNQAVQSGASLDHLDIRPSSEGGHRAICHAHDTSTCNNGYKPLDCASYPFFPTHDLATSPTQAGLISPKCPLSTERLKRHAVWVAKQWQALSEQSQAIRKWLANVSLVNYQPIRSHKTDNEEKTELVAH